MEDDFLSHYGTPRHSGRYPWGSGEDPYQRSVTFIGAVHALRKQGLHDTAIAKGMGMNTSELRNRISIATAAKKAHESTEALKLKDKGYSTSAIARRMGMNESSVRLLLDPVLGERRNSIAKNAAVLKGAVDQKGFIDIGKGAEQYMGISADKLKKAVAYLKDQEGYEVRQVPVQQLGTGKTTNVKVLAPPGTTWGDVAKNKDKIHLVTDVYSEDSGKTIRPLEPPKPVSLERVGVRYGDEGGSDKDGIIELRRGVADLSLGQARYAQVRISVEGTHFLKGVAIYSDDMPPGVDIVFNTNKAKTASKLDAMKPIKMDESGKPIDPINPFGASIKPENKLIRAQKHYLDADGKEQLSALNIVNEEGDWSSWSKNLSSQMLSKQNPVLAAQQLKLSRDIARDEFKEIMSLTNPTVRANLLGKFADQCDSDAVHLQAAALPRQANKVIIPFPSMNPSEIYAPDYHDGETVVLIRYPHGGTFEIPTLTVNNKHAEARKTLGGDVIDAVGIHPKVAERLSGADFDGDTVVVIPVDNVSIKTSAPLRGLQGFSPREQYPGYPGMHRMTSHETGLEMGKASNLITDMTIKGATTDEIVRAVRHSMVVIDAEKHGLDYKKSEVDNGIAELKRIYQGREDAGAATLLSRSTSEIRVNQRKEKAVSKMTPEERARYDAGEKVYEDTGKTYNKAMKNPEGEVTGYKEKLSQDKTYRMAATDDAYTLVSGTPTSTTKIESVYADHANAMKALANQARKYARMEEDVPYSPSAKETYAKEYASLKAALNLADRNAPLERQAQLLANQAYRIKLANDPGMDYEHRQRLKGQELAIARENVGAQKPSIWITDREWEAINAGAVSKSFLKNILANADADRVRQLATPRSSTGMSPAKVARAKSMLKAGHTQADVARMLGVSVSAMMKAIK